MENPASSQLSLNDIIFEGRNKRYGAYLLRHIYHRHLFQATFIAVSAFILFLSIPLISKHFIGEPKVVPVTIPIDNSHVFEDVVIPEPEIAKPEPAVQQEAPPAAATEKFTDFKIVDNTTLVTDEIPNIRDLQNKVISTTTTDGPESALQNPPLEPATTPGTGTGTAAPDKVFDYVEEMPIFKSGEQEMLAYLGNNFRVPKRALDARISGIVYLSFTVTKTGQIADIKVLKGLGYGIDEEAKRVVASMPDWTPGKQNGRAVSVSYTLPFRIDIK